MTRSTPLLRPHLSREWPALASAAAATIVVTAAELARPLPLAIVIDRLLADRQATFELTGDDVALLAVVAALVLGISVLEALGNYVADTRLRLAGERITHRLRIATHAQLQRLSLGFHERHRHGDLVTRVTGDVNAVGELFSQSLGTIAQAALLLAGMFVVSVVIDPVLALAAFGSAPLLAVVTVQARRRLRKAARRQRAKEGEIAAIATETLGAAKVVKALGGEDFEETRLARHSEQRFQAGVETYRIENRFSGAVDVLGSIGLALVLVVGVLRVAAGAVSPGELVVMASYTKRMYRPLRDIARQAGRISRAMARAERVGEVLAAEERLETPTGAYDGPGARGELRMEGVSFAYEPGRPVLDHVSLSVAAGEKVAIVGPSGAGKSTIAALVARFYDPQAGRVSIDGRDLRDCDLGWLRRQVGLVLQDSVLFTGTVAENIAYGFETSREEIIAAARAAAAHPFINDLPDGYDTELGPRAVALSGGQRQRIAIARTLLRDPAILVLDEPTTGLDEASEAQVLQGLDALMRERTTLVITHSAALAARTDRVIRVQSGAVFDVDASGRPAPRKPAAAVPADPALPTLRTLLDREAMAPVLARSLGREAGPAGVRVRYLRYKPRTNLVVHYDVLVDGGWHGVAAMIAAKPFLRRRAAKPENIALARLVDGRSPAERPLFYDEAVGALVQWLPLDLSLPGLAEPPARLAERLEAAGGPPGIDVSDPSFLAYKPRRRAVWSLGEHVAKVYAKDTEFRLAAAGLRESSRLPRSLAPRLEAVVGDLRVTLQTRIAGDQPPCPRAAARDAGRCLAELRRAPVDGLPTWLAADQLSAAAASCALVVILRADLRDRVRRVLSRLEDGQPTGLAGVASHGDFNARQLLLTSHGVAVVDFDAMCVADPALDPATYAAYVARGLEDDLDESLSVLDLVVNGRGLQSRDAAWYLATALLRRSPRPFRYLEDDWPERVEGMVRAAEQALAR